VIHGGINGEENQMIADTNKEAREFACFDFQTCSWMKIRQAHTEVEDQPSKPIHLAMGLLAYHSMTPVWEPTLSRNYHGTFYSRFMWVKQPNEIMNNKDKQPEGSKNAIKHQGLYVFGGLDRNREATSNALYVLKPAYTDNKKNISLKSAAFKRLIKPRYMFEVSEVVAMGGG
jgi:hypothetical protein